MKRFVLFLLALGLMLCACAPAFAYSYSGDTWLPEYRVVNATTDNRVYMYSKPSSSGNPISSYTNGSVLRVIDWNLSQSATYCYVIGPDGREGYVGKTRLLRTYPYDYFDDVFPYYEVNSSFYESGDYRLYMYAEPSSNGQPVGVTGYVNGTRLKVIDMHCDEKYCFCVGPDGNTGFVPKGWLTYVSGPELHRSWSMPASYYTGAIH